MQLARTLARYGLSCTAGDGSPIWKGRVCLSSHLGVKARATPKFVSVRGLIQNFRQASPFISYDSPPSPLRLYTKSYLFLEIVGCWWSDTKWLFRFWHWFRRFVFKLLSVFAWIKVMQQCLLMDFSVMFIPWQDETFSSIKILFIKLWSHFSSCPTRNHNTLFFVSIFQVIIVSANDY